MDFANIGGDMKELVELEIRELLEAYGFDDNLPVLSGSARTALEETSPSEIGTTAVKNLMDVVDSYIEQPERLLDAKFLLSIDLIHCLGSSLSQYSYKCLLYRLHDIW